MILMEYNSNKIKQLNQKGIENKKSSKSKNDKRNHYNEMANNEKVRIGNGKINAQIINGERGISLKKPDLLFEVSWEVCNKVGGIYTVIKSKARLMVDRFGSSNFLMVGPFFQHALKEGFIQKVPPKEYEGIFDVLKTKGIICHYGSWLIEGEPNVILLDSSAFSSSHANEVKARFWELYKIDSLGTAFHDYDEPLLWAYSVGLLIDEIERRLYESRKSKGLENSFNVVAHFHEWLAGGGLLYLKSVNSRVKTVFTTHATMLGRTISGNGRHLYNEIENINPIKEAYHYGIQAKHLTEVACAHNATVFATVSEITAYEAEKLLGKKPDIVTENGLDMDKYPSYEQVSIKHILYRTKIRDFLLYHFLPYYNLDVKHNLIFFIAARYEFISKGIDVFIEALAKLNDLLKKEKINRTITAFFWIPSATKGIKSIVVKNKTYFDDYKELLDDNQSQIMFNIRYILLTSKKLNEKNLIDPEISLELKRRVLNLKSEGIPPVITHDLVNESNDPILKSFTEHGLDNGPDSKVKVIFYPVYLNGADGVLDLSYRECILGSHLGVFPSRYEPWGYTPLEAAALGVPSITTDMSGFGRFINSKVRDKKYRGIFVADFMGKSHEEKVDALVKYLYHVSVLKRSDRIKLKIDAKTMANSADWKILFNKYILAYDLALQK
ncbi:MAG: glycosyltransferase [Nitrospiraceae bacterium]|nr:glycosyltransferase [Nitrospiraceae bacterium]